MFFCFVSTMRRPTAPVCSTSCRPCARRLNRSHQAFEHLRRTSPTCPFGDCAISPGILQPAWSRAAAQPPTTRLPRERLPSLPVAYRRSDCTRSLGVWTAASATSSWHPSQEHCAPSGCQKEKAKVPRSFVARKYQEDLRARSPGKSSHHGARPAALRRPAPREPSPAHHPTAHCTDNGRANSDLPPSAAADTASAEPMGPSPARQRQKRPHDRYVFALRLSTALDPRCCDDQRLRLGCPCHRSIVPPSTD